MIGRLSTLSPDRFVMFVSKDSRREACFRPTFTWMRVLQYFPADGG